MKSNLLGPIAETYEELQSLHLLFEAAKCLPLPENGSEDDALRACWQSLEVGAINLEGLFNQLKQANPNELNEALERIGPWIVGTADTMLDIASAAIAINSQNTGNILSLSQSPNIDHLIDAHNLAAEHLLANSSTLSVSGKGQIVHILRYAHLFRELIAHGLFCNNYDSYDLLVAPELIRKAVLDLELKESTFISQFRASHQIPELLIAAINRHLENILFTPDIQINVIHVTLLRIDLLLSPVLSATNLLDTIMSADDYHQIRENLGKTSGSQSTGIHGIFLRKCWPKLYEFSKKYSTDYLLQTMIRSIGNKIDRWKISHMNLPRQKLGSNIQGVKSLIGSKDAYSLVQQMRESAESEAPTYLNSQKKNPSHALEKLENEILQRIAEITQKRFKNVQNRTGFFSDK